LQTVGHHVCLKTGGRAKVLDESPFLAEYIPNNLEEENKYQFLGSGYYYWDDNLNYAKTWGKNHCRGDFFIVESDLNLAKGLFLDLVGNRGDIRFFYNLMKDLSSHVRKDARTIAGVIDIARGLEVLAPGTFSYKVIRSLDYTQFEKTDKSEDKKAVRYVENKFNITLLNPRFIICLLEKSDVILLSKTIVYESK